VETAQIRKEVLYFFFFYRTYKTPAIEPPLQPLFCPVDDIPLLPDNSAQNYILTDTDFAEHGGAKSRYHDNIDAIKLVKSLEQENRSATTGEQRTLARYVGWGGIPQVFNEQDTNWVKEYNELKDLLDINEYQYAKGSVLNAHYTSKTVIDGIYRALQRFGLNNGKILEPACGIGNFIGLAPATFDKRNIYGVELDEITGKIAKYLYPESKIQITGFENTNFKNDEFDSVITNVPFGNYQIYDREYDKYSFFIHDYFIAKSIDKIRPNGIVAVITSKGTMDKTNTSVRKYLADRAELLGAIRLPNTAFSHAGTSVTADILFFKKRPQQIDSNDTWIHTGAKDGFIVNSYFIEHPEMMLGRLAETITAYGKETTLEPDERELSISLNEAIANLPENIYTPRTETITAQHQTDDALPADYSVKNFCYETIGNRVYMRINDQMHPQKVSAANYERLSHLIQLRKTVRKLLEQQIDNCTDEELNSAQYYLNNTYDRFVKRYGFLNSKSNRSLFREDADYALLVALENYDDTTKTAVKTDIFSKRTIRRHNRVNHANNVIEALQISKTELGKVDIHYIEKLTDLPYERIIAELDSHIYKNPLADFEQTDKYSGWETAAEYLSGNIRQKLRIATAAAENDTTYNKNVTALKQALPEDLTASAISVRMGATWIDEKYYEQFLREKFNLLDYYDKGENLTVKYESAAGAWGIDGMYYNIWSTSSPDTRSHSLSCMEITSVYGTNRMNAIKIAEHTLNLQTPSIYDTVDDKQILNKTETILVREKQSKLQAEFKNWVFDEPERRNYLVRKYNDTFNNIKLANYDGSYLTFPEMNPCIELKDYQKDAVERIITNGNTLLHHVVGAGKTYEMIAAAMKLKQYGLIHKPMFVVPNHLVMQWTREYKTLYPNANVLMATKKDLEKTNRLKFISRVATGDWDAIIIAASSFEKIPLSHERQEKKLQRDITDIETAMKTAKDNEHRVSVKNLQKVLKNKEAQLKKLMDTKKDDLIKFEDLGVDCLFIDEAHKYKNKFIFTKMNNVAGISKAMSQRATDLDMKAEFINEIQHGEKGVIFATGTPISNSMVEMFTMQSYLQRNALRERGIQYFDAWAANFGETQTALELAPSGQGYRTRTRFAKFTNLPELLTMYRSFADVKTADMLNLPTPKVNKQTIISQPSEDVLKLNAVIQERADKIYDKKVTPEEDNMLKITSDGKKLALDPRCFDPTAADDMGNKINLCTDNIYRIWKETTQERKTQIVFCDLSVPTKDFTNYDYQTDFDIYNDIKYKLINRGIPEQEIKFIHEANTDLRKQTLFDDVRHGNVRILLGSTEKCGAGTNIQDKLYALHHLDTPYRPSDLAQREGRIIRQGNNNTEVFIYTYVTERTFDSYSYQILENKQKFISQIDRGDLTIREASDIDETTLSYAEIKAITTANPKIKQKMELETEISRLRTLESEYRSNKYRLQDKINTELPQRIKHTEITIDDLQADIEKRNANITDKFIIQLGNKTYTERKEAGDILLAVLNSGKYDNKIIGRINGFDIIPIAGFTALGVKTVTIRGNGNYNVELSSSETGSIIRLENFFKTLEPKLAEAQSRLLSLHNELSTAETEVIKPFEYAETLVTMNEQLSALNAELDLNKQEVSATVIDDIQFKDEPAPTQCAPELDEDNDE
jgi:N12 class adenine-specific DNA methylase/predicted RNA methylase